MFSCIPWDAALAPGLSMMLPPMRRSWISTFATAWLGLALAVLRAIHAFLASPSQGKPSGL